MHRQLRIEVDNLRDTINHCEELIYECQKKIEHSTTVTKGCIKEINKWLKTLEGNIEDLRCTHNEENQDSKLLIAKCKSVMKHSGASMSNQITSYSDNNEV